MIRCLNCLPPARTCPPSHWIFGTCRLDGTKDIFVAKHSTHNVGKGRVFEFASFRTPLSARGPTPEQASLMLRLMLDVVLDGDEIARTGVPQAPASWSFASSDMAWALTQKCIDEGVTKNLRQVGVCSTEELVILEQVRVATCQKIDGCPSVQFGSSVVSLGDNSKCHNCGIKQDCLFLPLLPCHCSEAFYHSYACKSKHREQHLEACMWACDFNHHVSIAPFRQAARTLMKSLQLDFGKSKESAR